MHIGIHNVGPVRKALIDLDDLTVLVGPNGSGKTTVSTILYASLLAHKKARRHAGIGVLRRAVLRGDDQDSLGQFVERVVDNWLDEFRDALEHHLKRCFGRDLTLIAREGRSGKGAAPRIVIGNTGSKNPWQLVFRIQRGGLVVDRKHKDFRRPRPPKVPNERQLRAYETQVRRLLVGNFPLNAVYFPAARSGFMQMRDALQSLLYGALGAGYFDHVTVGAIPGTAADFLQFLAGLDPRGESDMDIAAIDAFEQATLRGKILLRKETKGVGSSVLFQPDGFSHAWPIESAATSAAELAPLLLYLRHRADSRDAVFIDEPEAHFHPLSQISLAKHLLAVSASLSGLVLATHSDFVASGLSNALMEAHAEARAEGEQPRASVRLYEFCVPSEAKRGIEVREIAFDPTEGFDIRQFSEVADRVYDRAIELYNDIHAIGQEQSEPS
jgi:energy-coupling factor transporter ATP-binding protein EcfA2